jgi:hypothetical protein
MAEFVAEFVARGTGASSSGFARPASVSRRAAASLCWDGILNRPFASDDR